MHIMRRRALVKGLAGLEHATKMTATVQAAGVPVSLWVGGPGTVPGSVAWTLPLDSLAQWAEMNATLLADPAYTSGNEAGRDLVEGFEHDEIMRVVHGEVDRPTAVGEYTAGVSASIVPGRGAEALVFAAEIADAWSSLTGIDAIVATNSFGAMNSVYWFARHDTIDSVDAAAAKIEASESYAEVNARGDGLFTDGFSAIARRAA